ncbi:hypothetical protein [Pseudoxanthomonas putridarboris]|uniref:DUF4440 domain-containing protein n=1 Tax=Pseudoxanthomonas putridarboris TaxID=752605 RepID=A0ABU9J3H2_9GAMM
MNKLIAVAAVLLLAACDKSPVATTATPVAAASAGTQAAAVMPTAATPAGEATITPAAATSPADDPTAVNQAIDDTLGDHARYEAVIRQLQQAVSAKDATTVASLVDYPFTTVRDGKPLKVANADEFVREYDRIVTPDIADAITGQKYSQLMVNYKGVMFGNGEAWVNGICVDDACKEFNVRVVALQPGP